MLFLLILDGSSRPECASMAVDKTLTPVGQGVSAVEENNELLINALKEQIRYEIEKINQSLNLEVNLVASGCCRVPMEVGWF